MELLNLGCGSHYHKDWINIDFVSNNEHVKTHNLLNGIPINNDSIDVVYHSHLLEHFSKEDGFCFIQECYRVLKKDGIIRIAVPDLEIIAKEYLKNLLLAIEGDKEAKNNYEWIKLELFDQMMRNESGGEMLKYLHQPVISNETYVFNRIGLEGKIIRKSFLDKPISFYKTERTQLKASGLKIILKKIRGIFEKIKPGISTMTMQQSKALKIGQFRLGGEIHQWMYDRYSLAELLKKVGFEEIKICTPFESKILNWETYELDVVNKEIRKPDSLFIEAKKS